MVRKKKFFFYRPNKILFDVSQDLEMCQNIVWEKRYRYNKMWSSDQIEVISDPNSRESST